MPLAIRSKIKVPFPFPSLVEEESRTNMHFLALALDPCHDHDHDPARQDLSSLAEVAASQTWPFRAPVVDVAVLVRDPVPSGRPPSRDPK